MHRYKLHVYNMYFKKCLYTGLFEDSYNAIAATMPGDPVDDAPTT